MSKSTIISNKSDDDWISQAEAARIRGVSKQAIAKLIQRNRLSGQKFGGRVLLLRSEVEAFVPMPVGRPVKKEAKKRKTSNKTPKT